MRIRLHNYKTFLKVYTTSQRGFPSGSMVQNLKGTQETWVLSLGWEDPLEVQMATHSSILAWEIPWTERPGRLQSMGLQESDMT